MWVHRSGQVMLRPYVPSNIKSKVQEAKISHEHSDPHPTLIKDY